MTQSRQDAEKRGRRAEWLAEWFLRLKGYQILEKRAKTRVGEIDIIARKGHLIAIVEVKQRQSLEAGLNAVPQPAWERISRAAEARLRTKISRLLHVGPPF
jgi:putative endonuclease